ncbi:hypothetical protein Acor_64460 [Acrocarpospora corrugata]|uniref:HTH hxlR-type domain-containing protein n=1 Tax=Acrocarpospora corrugata TaxID=35763 RepID=A0A5M3WD72_9ACTN|nr:helix-turn-helix domain-containing protein [Acrocarpospora corrugata]GES04378.1 hypothetical protein Acor_64460 [Acrocarpospora corrugata]
MKKGYGQHCPIALGAEVFAERWTPIILRNLMVGCHRFSAILEGAPGLPRSVLSQRLRRLEEDGVVERREHEYHLTECGRELTDVCMALGSWGARWREPQPSRHDPYLVLWTMSRLISPDTLPQPRIVLRVELTDHPDRYWLVLSLAGNEVCLENPGFPEDGVLTADTGWLLRWESGSGPLAGPSFDSPDSAPPVGASLDEPGSAPVVGPSSDGPGPAPLVGLSFDGPGPAPLVGLSFDGPGPAPLVGLSFDGPGSTPVVGSSFDGPGSVPVVGASFDGPLWLGRALADWAGLTPFKSVH